MALFCKKSGSTKQADVHTLGGYFDPLKYMRFQKSEEEKFCLAGPLKAKSKIKRISSSGKNYT